MKVHLAPEDETVARMLERRAQFIEGVSWGIAAADRGDLIDHDEVANPHRAAFQL
jgi:predicted transcriptional regulator